MFDSTDNYTWYEIELPDKWPESNILAIKISDKSVAISKLNTQFFAYSNICPHAGAMLSEDNELIKDCIICPLHNYKFNIKTGQNISGEGYLLKRYKVETINDSKIKILL